MSSAEQLRTLILQADEDGFLGGEEPLRALASQALQIAKGESGNLRIVAFIMYVIFSEHADAQLDGPVSLQQAKLIWDLIREPINRGVEVLSGDENANNGRA